MAGFDFDFTYKAVHEPIVQLCLAAARTRANKLRISWKWRTLSAYSVRVLVNGNSRRIDFLGYRLERDLPLVAEGCQSVALKPSERLRLGRGFADLMLRGRHVDEDRILPLKGVADTRYYYAPYEFECPAYPGLHARLSVTLEVIVSWEFGEIAAEVLLEELHTACELVLDAAVNTGSKKLSFAELVDRADDAGLLTSQLTNTGAALLTDLKDLRKKVRHRAAKGAAPWVANHCEEIAILLERLVRYLNQTHAPDEPNR